MRRLALVLAVMLIASSPAWAEQPKGRVFGGATCATNVSCGEMDAGKLVSLANNCLTNILGIQNAASYFDTTLNGVGTDKCLKTINTPSADPSGKSVPAMVPYCCLIPAKDSLIGNLCILHCRKISVR